MDARDGSSQASRLSLSDQLLHDLAVYHGGSFGTAAVQIGDLQVIQPHELQDRGMQIVGVNTLAHRFQSALVVLSEARAGLRAAAGEPLGVAPGVVVAAIAAFAIRGAPELRGP